MAAATYRITLARAGYFLYVTTGREMPPKLSINDNNVSEKFYGRDHFGFTRNTLPLSAVYNKISYNVLIILYCQL